MKLQIRNATVQYGADTVLDRACFEVHDNEKIAVVGRNGCGKTTLLKLIGGELTMANLDSDEDAWFTLAGGVTVGFLKQISFEDGQISAEDELKKVFAQVYSVQDEMQKVEIQLSLATDPENHEKLLNRYSHLQARFDALGGMDCEREMLIMFARFGFGADELKKPIGQFSGGQQTKIAFMKLLLSKPDILLLDEPTNHLDLPTIEWLEDYLRSYRSAVVIVSHDRAFLDGIVSVTYEIEYGHMTRYSGNYTAFVKQKEANYAKQEKDYEAQQKEIQRLSEWIEKWKNTPTKISSVRSKQKMIEHMVKIEKPRHFDTKSFRAAFSPRTESYSEVLKVQNLSIGYDRELCKISFTLRKKEHLAVIGANGIGKSTLLKVLIGQVPALGGTYEYGKNVEWGYFDQQQAVMSEADPEQTVLENFWDTYPRLTREEARSALGCFVFSGEEVEKKIGQLSGGERVRLTLCKVFYTRPNLLILDEPTNHMDMIGKEVLEQMLKNFDGTVIVVSHDRYFVSQVATNILEFDGGRAEFYGMNYEDYRAFKKKKEESELNNRGRAAEVKSGKDHETPSGQSGSEFERLLMSNPGKLESRLLKKLEKLELSLNDSERKAGELKVLLDDPGTAADYEKLMEIQKQLEMCEQEQEEIFEEIMQAEEELETVRKNIKK